MKLSEYNNVSNVPGIYLIKNTINNKCYIGQSIRLRTRLQDHYSTAISRKCQNQKDRMILYKAIEKYGIDNFEYEILFSEDTKDFNNIKRVLDNLEKQYISEYNSYIPNGYNQTIGGDAGVLGLKMNEQQKETISKISHEINSDGRNMIYCFDTDEKCYYTLVSLSSLSQILGIKLHTSQIRYNLILSRYILARTKDELEKKKAIVLENNKFNHKNSGWFMSKLNEDMIEDLKNNMKEKEFCSKYNVCKKTYYNYKKKI